MRYQKALLSRIKEWKTTTERRSRENGCQLDVGGYKGSALSDHDWITCRAAYRRPYSKESMDFAEGTTEAPIMVKYESRSILKIYWAGGKAVANDWASQSELLQDILIIGARLPSQRR